MPLYEYECPECSNITTRLVGMSTKIKVVCKEDGSSMCRIISTTSPPIFKGSGFHCNDYKDK